MQGKVVVTGASGHIGYNVAKRLCEQGFEVTLLLRRVTDAVLALAKLGAKPVVVNLFDASTFSDYLKDIDCVFHIAAENTMDTTDEERVINNTFGLAKSVLDAAVKSKVKTIIYTSSVVVLGRSPDKNILLDENSVNKNPESPYTKGKLLAEKYCAQLIRETNADIRSLYPSWVVGDDDPKLTPPHRFIKNYVQKGQKFYFEGGISISSVDEVAKAHINAWLKGKPQGQYVLGGDNITFQDFYKLLAKYAGVKPPFFVMPKPAMVAASKLAKMVLGKNAPADPAYVKSVVKTYSWYKSGKAEKELGYKVIPAEEIVKDAVLNARKRLAGTYFLQDKQNNEIPRIQYADDDVLLITGFPGWLGKRMVDVFMNGDTDGNFAISRKVKLLVQPKYKSYIKLPQNFEIIYGDITDKKDVKNALKNVKTVYHLAGAIYPKRIKDLYKINFEGTKNLVDACIESGVKRFMYMSTDSVSGYGTNNQKTFNENTPDKPYKHYGKSKYLAEKYVLDKTKEGLIEGTSLRGFWFFGAFMPQRNTGFIKMFNWPRQLVFGSGKNLRSVSNIDNVIQAFIKAEKANITIGKWYWIGSRKTYSVDEIYKNIETETGKKFNPFYVPDFACNLFSVADSALSKFGILHPAIHAAGKFHKNIAGDISAAERDFGYNPAPDFREIKQTWDEL